MFSVAEVIRTQNSAHIGIKRSRQEHCEFPRQEIVASEKKRMGKFCTQTRGSVLGSPKSFHQEWMGSIGWILEGRFVSLSGR